MPDVNETPRSWMIYGVNGYTGRLCAEEALKRGLQPILAGRNRQRVAPVAAELNLPCRVFDIADRAAAVEALGDVTLVLNCAGPFSATARNLLEACVQSKTHYLDVTGEISVFEYVHSQDERWKQAGIAVLPGAGFDVVPTDCMAAMLHDALPGATHLRLAFKSRRGRLSPGTTKTVIEGLSDGCVIRRNGKLVHTALGSLAETIPFPDGPALSTAISWGDVSTAYYSTGIQNIEVYTAIPEHKLAGLRRMNYFAFLLRRRWIQQIMKRQAERNIVGPSEEDRGRDAVELYGQATDAAGRRVTMTMRTPNGYSLTSDSAITLVEKVLQNNLAPGAYTPSMAFGKSFVQELNGVACDMPK